LTEQREMYHEISTLLGHLAAALEMSAERVAHLLEAGDLDLRMDTDEEGRPFIEAAHGAAPNRVVARVYRDTVFRARETPASPPDEPT